MDMNAEIMAGKCTPEQLAAVDALAGVIEANNALLDERAKAAEGTFESQNVDEVFMGFLYDVPEAAAILEALDESARQRVFHLAMIRQPLTG